MFDIGSLRIYVSRRVTMIYVSNAIIELYTEHSLKILYLLEIFWCSYSISRPTNNDDET